MRGGEKQIYFVRRADGTGPIKIGCSGSLDGRLRQLCIDYRAQFVVLATGRGDFLTERNVHLKFASAQTAAPLRMSRKRRTLPPGRSEWFSATPELLDFIAEVACSGEIPLSDQECRERIFAERYRSGETLQQIADDYGITRERVRQVLRDTGVESLRLRAEHKRKPHDLTADEITAAHAYATGVPPKQLKERYGVTYWQMRIILRRLGLPTRKPGGWNKRPDYDATAARVIALYRKGETSKEIAKQVGFAHHTYIYRVLKRAGVAVDRRIAA